MAKDNSYFSLALLTFVEYNITIVRILLVFAIDFRGNNQVVPADLNAAVADGDKIMMVKIIVLQFCLSSPIPGVIGGSERNS